MINPSLNILNKSSSSPHLRGIVQRNLIRCHSTPASLFSKFLLKAISFTQKKFDKKRFCMIEHVNIDNKKDMGQISTLYKKSLLKNQEGFGWSTEINEIIPKILSHKTVFKASTFLIIRDDKGDIVGFGALEPPAKRFVYPDDKPIYAPQEAEICMVHIDADKGEGCGYGAKIIKALLEHAKTQDVNKVYLRVVTAQERAIKLYHNLGFKIDERFKEFEKGKAENSIVSVVEIGNLASGFKGTQIEEKYNDLKKNNNGKRTFEILPFCGEVDDLLKTIRD